MVFFFSLGSKAILVDGADETEEVAPSNLRRKAAIIDDDPKYKGRKASRKDLYSDGKLLVTFLCVNLGLGLET